MKIALSTARKATSPPPPTTGIFLTCLVAASRLLTTSAASAESLCPFSQSSLSGLESEYAFGDLGKLSILGFHPTVSYVSSSTVSTPSLKILGASETPLVYIDTSGILTVTTGTCSDQEESSSTNPPTEASSSSRISSLAIGSFIMNLFGPSRFASVSGAILAWTCLSSLAPLVLAQDSGTCLPAVDIEITMPTESQVTEKFGETDHYLAATLDTVTWGYYDPNATAAISMQSGETITVEVITHHSSHDYAKMIRGDAAVEEIFYWEDGQATEDKPEPKLIGTGVHLITGPIEVVGAEVGDVLQVDILELDPRYNPETGRCFGTNSQKFAGYQYRVETKLDGTPYVTTGGTEAITVFEFIEDENGDMLYGKPVYMYRFPNMTAPDGSIRNIDNNPAVVVPHEFDHGYNGTLLSEDPIVYPAGYNATVVTDEGGIKYLSPDPSGLDWKVPLRPHIGTLAVLPNNTANYLDEEADGGANSIPPSRFGGNVDDWRIGKGGTMYYNVEVPGGMVLVGDTHAAQGDSELAGTAMETSMTTKLRITLHKAGSLPKHVQAMPFPLLETSSQFVVHGFAFSNYLDQLEDASTIFAEGASLDQAFEDCFLKTRAWMIKTYDLTEEEAIAIMTTAVDFGVTQVVDGNWGAHADIPKWVFEDGDTPYDYSCTTSQGPGRRNLSSQHKRRRSLRTTERRQWMKELGLEDLSPEDYASTLYHRVTKSSCESCADSMDRHVLSHKFLDAKLHFAKAHQEKMARLASSVEIEN